MHSKDVVGFSLGQKGGVVYVSQWFLEKIKVAHKQGVKMVSKKDRYFPMYTTGVNNNYIPYTALSS